MAKKLQAYFQNEDKALIVKNKLLPLEVTHMEIGDTGWSAEEGHLLPLIGSTTNGNGTGTNMAGGMGASGVFPGGFFAGINGSHDQRDYPIVLSGEVNDEFYKQALEVIQDNCGQVERI